jgi:uncharacterized damage-inducible protein DinB
MTPINAVRYALEAADRNLVILEDMRDAPLKRPMARGNHPMWILGHLAVTEGRFHHILVGEPNPVEEWKPMFDWGTEPHDDASGYPPFEEVVQRYRQLRERTLQILFDVGEAGLERPTAAPPPGLETILDTFGKTLLTLASHQSHHCGQASVIRKAAGREPFFVPSAALRAS